MCSLDRRLPRAPTALTDETKKRLLMPDLDIGQVWVRWTPDRAERDPELCDAVASFHPVDSEKARQAGEAAATWLRERALLDYRSTVTRLLILDGVLEGFYSLTSSQVELRTSHRKDMGQHPIQPAALVTWLAKRDGAKITGMQLLAHAVGTALRVSDHMGVVALVLDPYDEAAADVWRAPPYNFKNSRTLGPDGTPRLWRTLLSEAGS